MSEDEHKTLGQLARAIERFRALDGRMPSSYMVSFLFVALDPGKGPAEYARRMRTSKAVMSRYLLEVGQKSRIKKEPLGLIDCRPGASDLRKVEYYLTAKGRDLLKQILATR